MPRLQRDRGDKIIQTTSTPRPIFGQAQPAAQNTLTVPTKLTMVAKTTGQQIKISVFTQPLETRKETPKADVEAGGPKGKLKQQ